MAVAPFFPEYRPFADVQRRSSWWWCRPTPRRSRSTWTRWKSASPRPPVPRASSSTPPITPPAWCIPEETLKGLAAGCWSARAAEYGHPIYIIADEPYRELVYGGVEVPFIPTAVPATPSCATPIPSPCPCPGERIGYVCVPGLRGGPPRRCTTPGHRRGGPCPAATCARPR